LDGFWSVKGGLAAVRIAAKAAPPAAQGPFAPFAFVGGFLSHYPAGIQWEKRRGMLHTACPFLLLT